MPSPRMAAAEPHARVAGWQGTPGHWGKGLSGEQGNEKGAAAVARQTPVAARRSLE